jgi:hypothetical protein
MVRGLFHIQRMRAGERPTVERYLEAGYSLNPARAIIDRMYGAQNDHG